MHSWGYVLGLKRNHPRLYTAVEKDILQEGDSGKNLLYEAL